MSDRFYSPRPITGDKIVLDGQEAHHLLHVMRAKVGTRVTLFDGSGAEFAAEISRCGRSEVETRIIERRDVNRELAFELVVGVSLPKGDRQKWLVEKLTELGVTELVPLQTERGVAQPTDGALERLERSVVEAAKQCGRNRLMRVAKPQAWPTWLTHEIDASSRRSTIAGMPPLDRPPRRKTVGHHPTSPRRYRPASRSVPRAVSPTTRWLPQSPPAGKASTSAREFYASKRRPWRSRRLSRSRARRRLD